jgi:serine/threonine protein kinase
MSGVARGRADKLAGWGCSTAVDGRGAPVPHVGTVIADRYVLRECLANGSTGEVWLSTGPDRPVVVKLLAEDIEAPVRGTPLIEFIEQGRADGRTYLVLEHAPGGSLRDVLRR